MILVGWSKDWCGLGSGGTYYLRIIIKEYNLVLALIVAYNGKRASNISINKFK